MASPNEPPKLSRTRRARQEDVVAAAIAVINSEGFGAASVDRIAAEAETSKATVLYHFGSKRAVLEAVVKSLFQRGADYMTARVLPVQGRRAQLQAYIDSNLRFIAENTDHVIAALRIMQAGIRPVGLPTGVDRLRNLLVAGQEGGEFGEFDPLVTALCIRAVVDSAASYLTGLSSPDIERSIEEVVRLFDRATAR